MNGNRMVVAVSLAIGVLIAAPPAAASPGDISTVAGGGINDF